jgi:hypothetical protein
MAHAHQCPPHLMNCTGGDRFCQGIVKFQFAHMQTVEDEQHVQHVKGMCHNGGSAQCRFKEVTIAPLRQGRARYYCWVLPGENLAAPGHPRPWVPCQHGGFMYLLTHDNDGHDDHASKDEATREQCIQSGEIVFFELTLGHTNWVRGCCVLPSDPPDQETQALSCGADKHLWLWDLETGRAVMKFVGHSDWVWCCSVVALPGEKGKRAVSGSSDKTLVAWDLETGAMLSQMKGHSDWVMSCCVFLMGDELRALSSSRDKTMKLWDMKSYTCIATFEGHGNMVGSCVVYLENGSNWKERARGVTCEADRALTCSDDMTLKVWNLESQECLHTLVGHTDIVISCCVFREEEGQHGVSCSADGTMRLWDLANCQQKRVIEDPDDDSRVRGCCAFSDGSKLLSCKCWQLSCAVCAINPAQSSSKSPDWLLFLATYPAWC